MHFRTGLFAFVAVTQAACLGVPNDTDADSAVADITDTTAPNDIAADSATADIIDASVEREAGGPCQSTADCPMGAVCAFEIGCGVAGHCVYLDAPCDAVDIHEPYCTCEGTTLEGRPQDCPGSLVPWAHRGACDTDATNDAGE